MKNYSVRRPVTIRPNVALSQRGNRFNSYQTLFVKGENGGIRMKNMPEFRLIEVNNLLALENYDLYIAGALDKSRNELGSEHKLTKMFEDLQERVQKEIKTFIY